MTSPRDLAGLVTVWALLGASLAGCRGSAPARTGPMPSGTAMDAPDEPAVVVGRESDDPEAHLARMKAVIRQDAVTSYGAECGGIQVPDEAMIPVEITGGGLTELAVSYGRVQCGIGPTRFSGTGGVLVQFWIGSGGPVRLLLEHSMHGFTAAGDRLVTMQHGGFCPGGAGPDQCRVVYQWNDRDRRLDVVERRLASSLPRIEPMQLDWETLSRVPPGRASREDRR